MNLIQLNDICKFYYMGEQTVKALDHIDLTIKQNEYIAFIGSSGSGKSTMMNILGCLDKPTQGEYLLNGKNVADLNANELAEIRNIEIGFIFQSFNLLPRASALNNVMLPLVYRGISLKQRKAMAMQALEKVKLADRVDHIPSQLSGGQRQRVAIARALVTKPSILLADEPTGNLDTQTTTDIMELFDQLHKEGQTIIMVTHENEIAEHCHRVVRLSDGKVIKDHLNHHEVVNV
ncbi:ABC transporter ATP-binding protein [Aliikangiella sp. IMCC44359]|uniref:ABC transporter ATP-binding protein n=1 Tax=Aliikangiella sp. IMCC44359 TaxID=3459125 RepID=UPI00403AF6EA